MEIVLLNHHSIYHSLLLLLFFHLLSLFFFHSLSSFLFFPSFYSISRPFIEHWLYPAAHMWRDHTHINSYRARVQLCFKLRLPSHCGALGVEVKGFRLASTRLGLATCCAFPELPQSAYASFTHTLIYIIYTVYIDMCAHTHEHPRILSHTHTEMLAAYAPINKHKLSHATPLAPPFPLSLFSSTPISYNFFYICHKQQFFILFACFPASAPLPPPPFSTLHIVLWSKACGRGRAHNVTIIVVGVAVDLTA